MADDTICAGCGRDYSDDMPKPGQSGGAGYGEDRTTGKRYCYDCCALHEWEYMREHGRGLLYDCDAQVTDWAGRLAFRVRGRRTGRHNMAGKRYDLWFTDRDGKPWHGVRYGDGTQVVHCRRLAS